MSLLSRILTLTLVLGAPLLGSSYALARETETEVLESPQTTEAQALQVLARFPKIRIFIDAAPGNGHQAAAILLLKRVRQMGYVGKIEMIYDEKSVGSKLEFLLPPFQADHGVQFLPQFNVTVSDWQDRPRDPVDLALTAGCEFPPRPEDIFVKHLVNIHPSHWRNTPSILSNGDLRIQFPKIDPSYPLTVATPHPDRLSEFVEKEMGASPLLEAKSAGLIHLLQHLKQGSVDLLSAYGVGVGAPSKIHALTRALLEAKTRFPNEFGKPVVVGLLSNVNAQEWAQIMKSFEPNDQTRSPDLRARVAVLNIAAPDIKERLAHLSPDQITYVNIGSVSQDLWYYLMEQSTLPPTAAGANGVSFLLQKGKPFINTEIKTSISDSSTEGVELDALMTATTRQFSAGGTRKLLDLMIASRHPETAEAQIFKNYARYLDKRPDRVCATLLMAAPHLGQ